MGLSWNDFVDFAEDVWHGIQQAASAVMHWVVDIVHKTVDLLVRGHCAYYAVPGNSEAIRAFRTQAARHWYRELRRRGQRTRLNWERMDRLATRWLPPARIMHPWPSVRFDARTRGRSPVR